MIRVVHPGSRIRILTFYPSRIQRSKRHRIPDPDPQHWFFSPSHIRKSRKRGDSPTCIDAQEWAGQGQGPSRPCPAPSGPSTQARSSPQPLATAGRCLPESCPSRRLYREFVFTEEINADLCRPCKFSEQNFFTAQSSTKYWHQKKRLFSSCFKPSITYGPETKGSGPSQTWNNFSKRVFDFL
jgi:hypothetical protein